MTVTASWNNIVIAESDHTVLVEGNHYFPLSAVSATHLEESATTSHCPWKGQASYYSVVVNGERNEDAAWYYPAPLEAAAAIESYVAFWKGVEVTGSNPDEPVIPHPSHDRS